MAQLSNSPSQYTTLSLEARKSFALGLWFMDATGRPADLTGCSVTMVVKKQPFATTDASDATNLLTNSEAVIDDPLSGYALLNLQANELNIAPGTYPFVIVLTTSTGYSSLVVKGGVDILENPEFSSMNSVYISEQPQHTLEIVLRGMSFLDVRMGADAPPGMRWLRDTDAEKLELLHTASLMIPPGGMTGDVLRKASPADYLFEWVNPQAYDGTLNASGVSAGHAPVADGNGGWSWSSVAAEIPALPKPDWNAPVGTSAEILNKPELGSAALADTGDFAAAGHTHAGADIATGTVSNLRLPRVFGLLGISAGTSDPVGGTNGDIYLKIV